MGYKASKFVLKHLPGVPTAVALVIVLLAATAVSVTFALTAAREKGKSELARKERNAALASESEHRHLAEERAGIAEEQRDRAVRQAYLASVQMAAVGLANGDGALAHRGLSNAPQSCAAWEYRYLKTRLCPYSLEIPSPAAHVALDPSGRFLAIAGAEVAIWRVADGQLVLRCDETPNTYITSLSWTSDGSRLHASHGEMQGWSVWNAATGELVSSGIVQGTGIGSRYCTVFDTQGRFRADSTNFGVSVLGLESRQTVDDLAGYGWEEWDEAANSLIAPFASVLHFTSDGSRLIGGLSDGTVFVDELIGHGQISAKATGSEISAVDSYPDTREIIVASVGHVVAAVSLQTGEVREVWKLSDPTYRAACVGAKAAFKRVFSQGYCPQLRFDAGGERFFFAGHDGVLRLITLADGSEVWSVPAHRAPVLAMDLSFNSQILVTASSERVLVYDLQRLRSYRQHCMLPDGARLAAVSPTGDRIAVAGTGPLVQWSATTGTLLPPTAIDNMPYDAIYSPAGDAVLVAGRSYATTPTEHDGVIRRISGGKSSIAIGGVPRHTRNLACHAPSGRVAAGGSEGEVVIFREQDGTLTEAGRVPVSADERMRKDEVSRTPLAFSDDGHLLAVAHGRSVRWIECRTGEVLASVGLNVAEDIACLALTSDGQRAYVGTRAEPRMFEIDRDGSVREFPKLHSSGSLGRGIRCLDLHSDDPRLASGGDDGKVVLWDTSTLEPVLTLERRARPITEVLFVRDSLLVVGSDGFVGAYDGDSSSALAVPDL